MSEPDLNLLIALDALITEESVAAAARRLGLSASAMSRTLSRLRAVTGDPLLVRAGRRMVLTPGAEALRERIRNVVHEARSVLRPSQSEPDLSTLHRTFTIRANDGFVEAFGHIADRSDRQGCPVCASMFRAKVGEELTTSEGR
jgi:DNA-binding transcriptional LysR family regulator